ncbi:MAG: aminoacyl-tRNA deacylase [Synergistales bacterium]|jgi:prolyl-tRNA editing enzyme YbaK/EbsC (Cys-tRNA(Pro) deacylase)
MSDVADPSAIRMALTASGFAFELLENRVRLKSAADGAAYWGISLGSTAPALVLRAADRFLLLILSGAGGKVDFQALAHRTGEKGLRMATPGEIRDRFRLGPGEVPLFGLDLPTFVDRRLLAHDHVYGGSGIPELTLKIAPGALLVLNRESRLIDVPGLTDENGREEIA